MSQKALLKILGDRPIAYHPLLAKLAGSVKAGILLSQLCYWQDRTTDPEGWVYKSREELLEETGLSRKEQDSARKSLRDLDLVDETLRRVPPRVHFRVDVERLVELLEESNDGSERGQSTGPKGASQLVRKGPIDLPPMDTTSGPEGANQSDRKGPNLEGTESTSETTAESTSTDLKARQRADRPKSPHEIQAHLLTQLHEDPAWKRLTFGGLVRLNGIHGRPAVTIALQRVTEERPELKVNSSPYALVSAIAKEVLDEQAKAVKEAG